MVRAGIVARCLRWTLEVLGKKTTSAPNVARCNRWTLEVPGHQPRPGLLLLVPPPSEGDLLCPSPDQQQKDDEQDENLPELPDQVDMDIDDSAADGDVNRHLQDGKTLKMSGQTSLDYADDCGLAKGADRWAIEEEAEEELTGVQKSHKIEWSKELDEDSDNPDDAERNPDGLSGLTQAHGRNGKSIHWGETLDRSPAKQLDENLLTLDMTLPSLAPAPCLSFEHAQVTTSAQVSNVPDWKKRNPLLMEQIKTLNMKAARSHANCLMDHIGQVDMDVDDLAADGDLNRHLQDGKALKMSGQISLDYADDGGLAKGGDRWVTEESDNPDDAERNSDAFSGLTQAHGKNGKSVHWGETGYSIYVKNLPLTATTEKVEIEFSRFGPITPGGVQVKRQQAGHNCFGFVEFESKESMRNALLASRVMFEGRPAFVEEKRAPIRDGRDQSQNYARDQRQNYQLRYFPNYQSQNFQNESGLCVRDRGQNYAHDRRQKYQSQNFPNNQPQNFQNESGNYQPRSFQTYQRRNFQNESGNRQPRNFQNESGESHDFQNGVANSGFGRSGYRNQGNNSPHDRVQSHRPHRF